MTFRVIPSARLFLATVLIVPVLCRDMQAGLIQDSRFQYDSAQSIFGNQSFSGPIVPLTTFSNDDDPVIPGFHKVSGEITNGSIGLFFETFGASGGWNAYVRDTYVLQGPIQGATVNLTATLNISGTTRAAESTGAGNPILGDLSVAGVIGGNFTNNSEFLTGNTTVINDPTGKASGQVRPLSFSTSTALQTVNFDVVAPLTVVVGTPFQLAYRVRLFGSLGTYSDFTDTATVSFSLPQGEGLSLTSENGFGAPMSNSSAVPEPSSFVLLATGMLAMIGYRRRKRNARQAAC